MPSISKAFSTTTIHEGGVSILTFVVTNDTGDDLIDWSFTDILPLDMVIATPSALSAPESLGITIVEGEGEIDVVGAILAAGEIVTFSVRVLIPSFGIYNNETSNLFTSEDEIDDSSGAASIVSLQNGDKSLWALMRFDAKTREEEEA